MDKLKMHSPDLVEQNLARIAELFPAVITEALDEEGNPALAVDFDLLRQELSRHVIEGAQERYQLDWPGKREALFAANAPVAKTLRPARMESVNFDTTKNLFIEGDNLDALKLLQESYLGKVTVIFIDPPYNTGHDFLYNDKFAEPNDAYMERTGQNENGGRLVSNTDSSGRFHSNWLSMMYPRLKLARNLLADDGVLFISIDDTEVANLRRLCDEIFGEKNFVVNAVWRSKDNSNNDAKRFSLDHNHILVYARTSDWLPTRLADEGKQNHFKNPDDDPKGAYFDGNPVNSPNYRENLVYSITSPNGHEISPPKNGWRWSREAMEAKIASGEIRFTSDGKGIRRRTYLADMQGLPPSSLWIDLDRTAHNRQAKYELIKLMSEDVFDTPKPVKLMKYILQIGSSDPNAVVMDFFAGSATLAHATMQLNAEDGGRRRFVVIQLDEHTDGNSEAHRAGFGTISHLSRERIRRAGEAIRRDGSADATEVDTGFRCLRVDSTNMADVLRTPDAVDQDQLELYSGSVKPDRTGEDLLFQVLLDWGLELTMSIAVEQIDGHEVFVVEDGALVACFDDVISPAVVRDVAGREPLRAVFRDSGFASDADRINAEQVFAEVSPSTDVKVV